MKFLVISSFKDSVSALPPDVAKQIMGVSLDHINQARKEGKILEIYVMPGWGRSMSIEEHDSAEELNRNLGISPIAPFINFEVYPLADFDAGIEVWQERSKAMEKLTPG